MRFIEFHRRGSYGKGCRIVLGCFLLSTLVISFTATAQTASLNAAHRGTQVTFDKDDLLNAMTDAEREEFLKMHRELKELQQDGRKLPKGSAGRRAVQAAFETQKTEFEEKFGHLRGFKGKTVTVYGKPAPTKQEIMDRVINGGGFRGGSFGYPLHPHWTREKSGAIIGSASPPKIKTTSEPSGSEVSGLESGVGPLKSRSSSLGESLSPEQHCRKMAGPVRSDWNYEILGEPKCTCAETRNEIYGIPSCWWYSDRR